MEVIDTVVALLNGVAKLIGAVSKSTKGYDMGCEWYCDNCDAHLNKQKGFVAGDNWVCTACGVANDVSENNILETEWVEDDQGRMCEILKPRPDLEDPEDY